MRRALPDPFTPTTTMSSIIVGYIVRGKIQACAVLLFTAALCGKVHADSRAPLPAWQQELISFHPTFVTKEISSHDRWGGNGDGGPVWLYEEAGWKVLFEAFGEGRITRLWMTAQRYDIPWWGEISIEVDGAEVLRGHTLDLFTGKLALAGHGLGWPLVGDDMLSSGGYIMLAPVPFLRHARIKISGTPRYYQVSYRLGVGSSAGPSAAELALRMSEAWEATMPSLAARGSTVSRPAPRGRAARNSASQDNAGPGTAIAGAIAPAAENQSIAIASGPVVLTSLALHAKNPSQTLIQLWRGSQLMWAVPMDLFFNDPLFGGGTPDSSRSILFATAPSTAAMMTRLPIPLHDSERLVAVGEEITQAQTTAPLPADAGWLELQLRDTTSPGPTLRSTMTLFETTGPTNFVHALVATEGHTRRWLEGDEMIRTDGLSFPFSIGTGTEDYFSGGWYFFGRHTNPFTGLVHFEADWAHEDYKLAMYRHHLEDLITGRSGVRFGLEAGDEGDFAGAHYRMLGWGYTWPRPNGVSQYINLNNLQEPTLVPGATALNTYNLNSAFDGERSQATQTTMMRSYKGVLRLGVTVPVAARFLVLSRKLDAQGCRQVATVQLVGTAVNSKPLLWGFTQCNPSRRLAEDLIVVPLGRTTGPATAVAAELVIDSTASADVWTEASYTVGWM